MIADRLNKIQLVKHSNAGHYFKRYKNDRILWRNNMLKSEFAKTFAMLATGLSCVLMAQNTLADAPEHRIINLQAEATREVANDEMQATLYTELNEKDAATLANKINSIVNQAMNTAKSYPKVVIKTGGQNTYPVYNDKQQLINWRGRAEVILNSQDFKQTSELIAKLQENMQLGNINFEVSDEQRNQVESELYIEASKAFQQRAKLLLAPWGASNYELVNLQLNANANRPMPIYAARGSSFKADSIESQNVEAGNSEITVIANGSIQLK
jgi:predicted secreted protein